MDAVKELIKVQGLNQVILILILVLVAVVFIMENLNKLKSFLGIKTIKEIHEEQQEHVIHELESEMNEFKLEVREIKNDQGIIKSKLCDLSDNLSKMQDKQDKETRSRNKDRLLQAFKFYSDRSAKNGDAVVKWNVMEKEAFDDLANTYADAGGNSFIHEKILPEVAMWHVTDYDNQ